MTRLHENDAVAGRKRFFRIVRHHDRGGLKGAQQAYRFFAHAVAQATVEVGEWLIHQQNFRLRGQGAGERHALLLAAGKRVRISFWQGPTGEHAPASLRCARAPLFVAFLLARRQHSARRSDGETAHNPERRSRCGAFPVRPNREGPAISMPFIRTLPASGVSTPAMMRSSVDLPQPERPTRQMISPFDTERSISFKTGKPAKTLPIPLSCSAATSVIKNIHHRRQFVDCAIQD